MPAGPCHIQSHQTRSCDTDQQGNRKYSGGSFHGHPATLDAITTALASGRDVELRNFGVFEVRLTKSRVGRNPKQPEKDVTIPAWATVKFKAGKIMRQRVLLRTQELSKK